ncbi:MAG: hypothetical protein IJI09_08395 [Clostridia bacterium]|nr:hypothetical protein [Clostridia bacterium]
MKNASFLLILLLSVFLLLPCAAQGEAVEAPETQRLVFYEIFPCSFSDSDGDGVGDLRGILNRLDYLNDGNPASKTSLGIQGIWMTPVFASPSYHKYDVTDYKTMDPAFGTLEDLQALIDGCHERGIRLILDLPLNHTSRDHLWFKRFRQARLMHNDQSAYYDYYLCYSPEECPAGHACYPLQGTDFWYEGNFSQDMPELNYDNEAVRQEALDIAKFYLDMGVDGFRFDAAKYISFGDNARSADFWVWFTGELRALSPDIWLVAEVWDGDGITDQYVPAMNCFNFTLSQASGLIADTASGGNANRYTAYVEKYTETVQALRPEAFLVPFISNHDMDRAAGYLPDRDGKARMAANLYLLGPGAPFIYYGEEIGLKGSRGSANTDSNRRLAMRWGDGDPVADPPGSTYSSQTENTVQQQLETEGSLLKHYQRVLRVRKENPEIASGACAALAFDKTKLGGFLFTQEGRRVAVLHNPTKGSLSVDLKTVTDFAPSEIAALLEALPGEGGASLEGTVVTLGACTSVVLR